MLIHIYEKLEVFTRYDDPAGCFSGSDTIKINKGQVTVHDMSNLKSWVHAAVTFEKQRPYCSNNVNRTDSEAYLESLVGRVLLVISTL